LRAAYNRAVRAPNVIELFYPQTVALDGASDPCAGHTIKSDEYGCIAQGLHVGQTTPSNPASQYNGLLGGVSTLQPETATTKTAGVVLQPRFLPRFAATLDYWNIDLKNAVQGFGADAILADCVAKSTSGAPAPSCSLIHRNPGGSLWLSLQGYVEDLPHNVGGMKTDGFDFTTSYSMPLFNTGNLSASFTGTLLHRYRVDNGLTAPYDCVGYYGTTCGLIPKWRHKLRLTWQSDFGLGISGQWRHQSHVTYEGYSTNTTLAGTHYQQGAKFPAYDYFDLAATYSMLNHNLNLRAGINNIFDKSPPLALYSPECPILATNGDTGCNGNVWVGAYDTLGRYIYAGFTLDFLHHAPPAPPPAPLPVVTPPPPEAPATQTCPDGSVILATAACPAPPPPPPPVVPERG
jgi:outer membrane receptor protein involved in Fe transport